MFSSVSLLGVKQLDISGMQTALNEEDVDEQPALKKGKIEEAPEEVAALEPALKRGKTEESSENEPEEGSQ